MDSILLNLLKKTEQLIKDKQEVEALEMLQKEIKNPLLNLADQDIIQTRISRLEKFIKQTNIDERWAKASKSELIKIFNSEGYEIAALDKLFEKFEKDIDKTDLLRLQQVFLDDSVGNELKIAFLRIFKEYGIDHKYQYHNTNLNKTFEVDLSKDFSIGMDETIFKIFDKLQALYFKETSKEQLSKQIIYAIYYYYFGDFKQIPYKYDELFNHIVDYVEHAFNNITPVNEQFSSWLNKILK